MRLSVVVPVLNSHEIVRRQILHWKRMPVPDDVEVIYMDDGSDPPIVDPGVPWLRIVPTHDTRPWTWAVARNAGARLAQAPYVLMTDIDYIIPREAIEAALAFDGDYLGFRREMGVLLEDGTVTQDMDTLLSYGLLPERARTRGVQLPPHPNNFVIRRDLFFAMGGYPEDRIGQPYPQGEDSWFKRRRHEWVAAGKMTEVTDHRRPLLLMVPNGQFCCGGVDANPLGLFHTLSRISDRNHWHTHPRSYEA
jgi:glycosyltransferase involved in cell wall biosynthesis